MRLVNFYSSTAIGLCLAASTASALADTLPVTSDELQIFSERAIPCIGAPSDMLCAGIDVAVLECLEDFSVVRCEVLLRDATATFALPEQRARVEVILNSVEGRIGAVQNGTPEQRLETIRSRVEQDETVLGAETVPDPVDESAGEKREEGFFDKLFGQSSDEVGNGDAEGKIVERPDEAQPAGDPVAEAEVLPADAPSADSKPQEEPDADQPRRIEVDPALAPGADPAEPGAGNANGQENASDIGRRIETARQSLLAEADVVADEPPELVVEPEPDESFVIPAEPAPEATTQEQARINEMLQDPAVSAAMATLNRALGGRAPGQSGTAGTDVSIIAARDEVLEATEVTDAEITASQTRSSQQEFGSLLSMDFATDSTQNNAGNENRDLELAGLAALSALTVGMIVNQNRVVARSEERVVVDRGEGDLELWRDDDAILLQDGSTRRIERYTDGSSRTQWVRLDDTQILTLRDATGRVLRRERVLNDGTTILLFDDTREIAPIVVSTLPSAQTRELQISSRTNPELTLAMLMEAEADARALDRSFSLNQVRETKELRELLPLLSTEAITFETNRANVRPDEVSKLLQVGRLLERLIAADPSEVFLVEGHTDVPGPAAFNLALSDRRAESVALALTEFFNIPPENLVVQGYGERYPRIQTLAAEERNRRVALRRVTLLIRE